MMFCMRVNVLLLLVGSAMSLNHFNFIGGGNYDVNTSDPEIIANYKDFFSMIHPGLDLPTKRPTHVPTVEPSEAPTVMASDEVPWSNPKPIPSGRFPSPVAPTPRPTRRTWPRKPSPEPTSLRRPARTSSYTAEWGSAVNDCDLEGALPNVFLNCHGGGLIELKESKDAQCSKVAGDRIQCTQDTIEYDPLVTFSCSGIRNTHLMATVTVGPNVVSDCEEGGNTLKFLTLSRECTNFVDVSHECNGGLPYESGDTFYCASPAVCGDHYSCSELKLEPLAMSNTNTDLRCSVPASTPLMNDHIFKESHLSSFSVIDWRISGQIRGCSWDSPPLLLKCENGGILQFEEDYPFCTMLAGSIGECESFAPFSTASEESIDLTVKCSGTSESQLVLSVEILSEVTAAQCEPEGTIIQSVMLSRKCGEIGTAEFLVNHPSFCDAHDQVFTVDRDHSHCFVGNTCQSDSGCSTLQIPLLTADTGSGPYGYCTYVE